MPSALNPGIKITRFVEDRIVVVRYNPPCPPIQIYALEGEKVFRFVYNNGPENHPLKIAAKGLDELVVMVLKGINQIL